MTYRYIVNLTYQFIYQIIIILDLIIFVDIIFLPLPLYLLPQFQNKFIQLEFLNYIFIFLLKF